MTAPLVRSFWHLLKLSILKIDSVMTQNLFLQWNSLDISGCNVPGVSATYPSAATSYNTIHQENLLFFLVLFCLQSKVDGFL